MATVKVSTKAEVSVMNLFCEKGYSIVDKDGVVDGCIFEYFGVVKNIPRKGFWQHLFPYCFSKGPFVGQFGYDPRVDKQWHLEVYGRNYLDELTRIGEEISRLINVNGEVILAREHERKVLYIGDLD